MSRCGRTRVRVHVQTRGTARTADYAFLGSAPSAPWWRAYRDVTAFDHPTVLVTSDGDHWWAYLSGIPSSRVDAVGSVVRYTLVLDGPRQAAGAAWVPAAVGAWLDDIAAGHGDRPGGRLTSALDARFPADDVERWLASDTPAARPDEPDRDHAGADNGLPRRSNTDEAAVQRVDAGVAARPAVPPVSSRAYAALASLLPVPAPLLDEPGDWIGAVAAAGPRAAFTARVAALVDGTPGRALMLNLVGGPRDVQPLLDPTSTVAVLIESTDPQLARCTALRPVVEAKKAPAPRVAVAAVGIAVLPLVAWAVLLATTALVVALIFWLL